MTSTKVLLAGGLGNQLFQLAAGLRVSEKSDLELITNLSHSRQNKSGNPELSSLELPTNVNFSVHQNSNFFFQKIINLSFRVSARGSKFIPMFYLLAGILSLVDFLFTRKLNLYFINNGIGFDSRFQNVKRGTTLIGYFQFAPEIEQRWLMKSITDLQPKKLEKGVTELCNRKDGTFRICLHVRLGDYRNEDTFGIPGIPYYRSSLEELLLRFPSSEVWLFSDEPDIASKKLESISSQITRIIGTEYDTIEVLSIMRSCDAYIIANSSFSWWGAFISANPSPEVFCPRPWFKSGLTPRGLYPSNWKLKSSAFGHSREEGICED